MESLDRINQMLESLSQAPNSQIDKRITDDLKELIGKPIPEIKIGTVKAIDYCVVGGLASDFAMKSLMIFHEIYLDGTPEDFNDENCPWRK